MINSLKLINNLKLLILYLLEIKRESIIYCKIIYLIYIILFKYIILLLLITS